MYDSTVIESTVAEPLTNAALLAVVADPVRWALIDRLTRGTACACDLRGDPPLPPNLLSYHLKMLRDARLVTTARRGRWIDYTLADDALERLRAALPAGTVVPAEGTPCG